MPNNLDAGFRLNRDGNALGLYFRSDSRSRGAEQNTVVCTFPPCAGRARERCGGEVGNHDRRGHGANSKPAPISAATPP